MAERMKFVVPGDEPIQIAGSPHLARLKPYGELTLYEDRPGSIEEQLRRVEGAEVIINTRGAVKWFRPALEGAARPAHDRHVLDRPPT